MIEGYIIRTNANFKSPTNPKNVSFGNSHPQCALNDSLIFDFRNYSTSGETYFYTFQKLKNVLDQNPSVDNVFISFSNDYINKRRDSSVWKDDCLSQFYSTFSPFLDLEDNELILKNNFTGLLNYFSIAVRKNHEKVMGGNYNYDSDLGGYLYLNINKTDSILSVIDEHNSKVNTDHYNTNDYYQSPTFIYLKKIINYCNANNKKIFLVRIPVHSMHIDLKNEKDFNEIINDHFSSTEFLDFINFPLSNSEFGDLGHLNSQGASIFSLWINGILKKGLLQAPDKQNFIDEAIMKRSTTKPKMY